MCKNINQNHHNTGGHSETGLGFSPIWYGVFYYLYLLKRADLILFTIGEKDLEIKKTYVRGTLVYEAGR